MLYLATQGEVLYPSLEDSFQRIQTRLFDLTEDAPPTLHFAIMADTLKRGLEQQIEQFLTEHSDTKLVGYSVSAVRAVTAICTRMTIRTLGF